MLKFVAIAFALTVAWFVVTVVPPAMEQAAINLREMGNGSES